jgi:hypothetical protein
VTGGVAGSIARVAGRDRTSRHEGPTAADEAHLHTKKGAIWQTINEHPKLLFQIAGMTVGDTAPLLRVGDLGPRRT